MKLKIVIPVLATAALVGGLLIVNTAGAKQLPVPAPTPTPPFATKDAGHNAAADQWAAWATDAIKRLDAGKENDNGLRFVVDQEDAVTDGNGKVRLCLNTVPVDVDDADGTTDTYVEPTDVNPADGLGDCPDDGAAAPYADKVISVMVDLAGNLTNEGNGPTASQTRFNVADGAVLVFMKNGEPIANETIRFTYVAVGAG